MIDMPTTIVGLLIIIFAILPGLPAYLINKAYCGSDWKATDWEKIVSIITYSVFGLILYSIISSIIHLPPPIYVIPSTFNIDTFGISSLLPISISFIGHIISSIIISCLYIFVILKISKFTPSSPFPSAWDDFIRTFVPKHWVVVQLINDETYAGYINRVNISVNQTERDIILSEPAKYSEDDKNYKVIPYQQLYLPANMVASIAIVHDPERDNKRITQIGSNLFPEEKHNE